jgi:organic radical activating enzyme
MGTEQRLIAIESKAPYLAVTWQVNNFCNFKCSYCNPGNYNGANRNDGNLDIYLKNLKIIINKYTDLGYKDFKFFFSGGEPSVWENLIPICDWLKTEVPNVHLAINTNLSRSVKWWETNYNLFDDVVASFHIEFANKERYKEVSYFLCDKINYLSNKMLMHEERFWEVVEFGNSIKESQPNYFLEWTPLFDEISINAGPWKYADPEKTQWINEHNIEQKVTIPVPHKGNNCVSFSVWEDGTKNHTISNDIIVKGLNFFTGWSCNIGDSIFINPKGDVSLASCGQGERLGHILDDISSVGPKTITCGKYHCACGTDIIIPKWK